MSEPTPYALSHHLGDLLGRRVTFTQTVVGLDGPITQVYGIYDLLPKNTAILVKADLPLLGSFAGILVGLPDAEVKNRLKTSPIDELLRDAMAEVLNISSTVVTTEGRAVFARMVTGKAYVDGAAGELLSKPIHRSYFNVTVQDYTGGRFTIFS